MTLILTPVQKTKKYRRYFEKSTNTSVAAGAKEVVFSKTFVGKLKEFTFLYDGDDSTGTMSSKVYITIDSITVMNGFSFSNLYDYFSGGSTSDGGIIKCTLFNNTSKKYGFKICCDCNVANGVVIEIENADTTNPATVTSGLIYDVEI